MKKLTVFFLTSFSTIIIIFFLIFSNTIDNVYNTSFVAKYGISYFMPEGWGFFTRNPREAEVDLYISDTVSRQMTLFNRTTGDVKYYFGADRKSRRIGMEISMLLSTVSQKEWKTFYGSSTTFKDSIEASPVYTIKYSDIPNLLYTQKGHYLLVFHEAVPFLYWDQRDVYTVKYKLLKLNII